MFHDLNICVPPSARADAILTCDRLGYDVVALSTTIRDVRKLSLPAHAAPPLSSLSPSPSPGDARPLLRSRGRRGMTVLTRATVHIDDPAQLQALSSSILRGYDIVAVVPGNDKLLAQVLQFDIDVVSLDFAKKPPFYVKRPQLNVAAEKGVQFEINYAQALGNASSRRFIIGNSVSLSRTTMGKQTLLSSGATNAMHLRAPHDVMNLAQVFGLSPHHARAAIVHVASAVVAHGDIRANTHKGVVRRLEAADVTASFPQRPVSGSGDGVTGGKHSCADDEDGMNDA